MEREGAALWEENDAARRIERIEALLGGAASAP
jgi:hypothetical protein